MNTSRFQNKFLEYTKGTGDYNKFRRGYLEGYMVIHNVTDAEAGLYECVVDTAVGTIYASSDVFVHGPPGSTCHPFHFSFEPWR